MKNRTKLSVVEQTTCLGHGGWIGTRMVILGVLLGLTGFEKAEADSMLYRLSGIGSGTLGSNSFLDVPFTITSTADTSQIRERPYGVLLLSNVTATVSVSGFGIATFTIPTDTVANRSNSVVGVGAPIQDDALLFLANPAFSTYDLRTSIGPIAGPPSRSFDSHFATTAGVLSLSDVSNVTFQAVPTVKLNISLTSTNTAVVSWPSPSVGWVLQQADSVTVTNWGTPSETINNNGTNNFIIVNPPVGARFYRLLYP